MSNFLKNLVKKQGYGIVMAAIGIDGYRRTVRSDLNNETLDIIRAENEIVRMAKSKADREIHDKNIAYWA
jgi:hypothetical protein